MVEIGPRIEAGAGRPARRGVRPVVGEERAGGGQPVERGRLDDRVVQRGEAVPPPLVDGDEEDVAVQRSDPGGSGTVVVPAGALLKGSSE